MIEEEWMKTYREQRERLAKRGGYSLTFPFGGGKVVGELCNEKQLRKRLDQLHKYGVRLVCIEALT